MYFTNCNGVFAPSDGHMTEKFSPLVCVKESPANTELDVFLRGAVSTTTERMGMSRDNVFKDLVHARTSVEANCLFLLVDCLPTLWSVISSDYKDLCWWRSQWTFSLEDTLATLSQQVGSSGTFFFFLGTWTFCCVSSCTVGCFSSVLFCVGIILFEVVMVLRFVYDLISTEENMWMGQN